MIILEPTLGAVYDDIIPKEFIMPLESSSPKNFILTSSTDTVLELSSTTLI